MGSPYGIFLSVTTSLYLAKTFSKTPISYKMAILLETGFYLIRNWLLDLFDCILVIFLSIVMVLSYV
jgi:hypothetical protein